MDLLPREIPELDFKDNNRGDKSNSNLETRMHTNKQNSIAKQEMLTPNYPCTKSWTKLIGHTKLQVSEIRKPRYQRA